MWGPASPWEGALPRSSSRRDPTWPPLAPTGSPTKLCLGSQTPLWLCVQAAQCPGAGVAAAGEVTAGHCCARLWPRPCLFTCVSTPAPSGASPSRGAELRQRCGRALGCPAALQQGGRTVLVAVPGLECVSPETPC